MRAFCTVSAPLEVCASSADQLSPGSRFLALRLLGNHPKTLYFLVDAKSRVREVYTQTCLHFATQGMQDTELFGLAVLIDGEYMFADPESKLSKYGPKSWRSSHTHGLDANGRPLLELHFRVQFYIESPFMLKDEHSRHNYYLQLRYNALHRDILKEYSEQSMILLAGLALQADIGDSPLIPATNTTNNNNNSTTIASKSANQTATNASALISSTTAKSNNRNGGSDGGNAEKEEHWTGKKEREEEKEPNKDDCMAKDVGSSEHEGLEQEIKQTKTIQKSSITTTLPKITKRTGVNGRLLRLSTHGAPATPTANAENVPTSSSSSSSSSVFPISGSIKRSLGAVAATLSPSSSLSGLNRSSKHSTNTVATTASHSSPGNSISSTSTEPIQATASIASTIADYFNLEDYLPVGLRTPWAANALRACHRENRGMSASDAERQYIRHACLVHESINAHTYHMRMSKSESGAGNSWFVVYAKGVKIFSGIENGPNSSPQQQTTFLWPNITKLSFERKKFEIRSGDNKITLYASSDEKNKMLLTLCKETHQFSMKIAARLKEVIKREEEENNCLQACHNYSRSLHLPYKNKNDQRISVISSTSSNTTSGIVSDRVHSEDELEIMINSPPAPIGAPSTESLALAHLLDHPSVSRQTSSVGQVSFKDLEEQLAVLSVRQAQKRASCAILTAAAVASSVASSGGCVASSAGGGESPTELSHASTGNSSSSSSIPTTSQRTVDSSQATDSPNSQHNIGSQCSSTCSTVVVTTLPGEANGSSNDLSSLTVSSSVTATPIARRNSTSSSLELGFSHTAQNSVLSESESTCNAHDFSTSTRDETESVSGVYTLAHGAPPTETSGVYTMHSSEMTGQSSEIAESEKSSHYGMFQPAKSEISDDHLRSDLTVADSVDGGGSSNLPGAPTSRYMQGKRIKNQEFRLRSDSNISASGSFRGDGSDPTDNKHTLLSADELSDLIVGRGSYPNRKTVASTLDSDCDYVTLPLAMEGESYLQGHQDTAPTEDHVEDIINDLLPTEPPAPPKRLESDSTQNHNSLSNIRMRSPPPYDARHDTTGLRGPPIRLPAQSSNQTTKITIATPSAIALSSSTVASTDKKSNLIEASNKLVTKSTAVPVTKASATITSQQSFKTAEPPVAAVIRRRDPPPYPNTSNTKPRPTSLISATSSSSSISHSSNLLANSATNVSSKGRSAENSQKSEEVQARFITTRPHINILKAHTSMVNESPKPSYAALTHNSSAASSIGSASVSSYHVPSHLSQNSSHNSNYASGSQLSLNHHHSLAHSHHHAQNTATPITAAAVAAHAAAAAAAGAGVIPSTIGIPIVPYSLHSAHKSMSSLHHHHHHHLHHQQQPPPPPPPYTEMKPATHAACVLLPVIKPRQYMPPPPPSLPRQPPPPPPNQLSGLYTTQLAHKQMELYQQQLYSDVDYVIYPIQDPSVSQQEYLDAKQGSILAAMAQTSGPSATAAHSYLAAYHTAHNHASAWDTYKGHAIYRSTPYLPLALSTHSRYASTQNLSDTYVQLPNYSPIYSPSVASLCSSYEAAPPPPLHPALAAAASLTSNLTNNATIHTTTASANYFARSRSDENILNTIDVLPRNKRLPPPPPPPYVDRRVKKPPMPSPPNEKPPPIPSKPSTSLSGASLLNVSTSQKSASALQISSSSQKTLATSSSTSSIITRKPHTLSTSRSTSHMTKTSSGAQWAGERPKTDLDLNRFSGSSSILAQLQASMATTRKQTGIKTNSTLNAAKSNSNSSSNLLGSSPNATAAAKQLDIALLREKSKHMDLPLISALCNDRSLLKQTKILTNPKHARHSVTGASIQSSTSATNNGSIVSATTVAEKSIGSSTTTNSKTSTTATAVTKSSSSPTINGIGSTSSITSTNGSTSGSTTLSKQSAVTTSLTGNHMNSSNGSSKTRKTLLSHRHPNDKLPPLPVQLAEANNYVMDPALHANKQKLT